MAGKKLDEPHKVYSGFKGTQPGLTNRQMKSIMKSLQKIKIKKIGMEDGGDVVPVPKRRPKNFEDIVSINVDKKPGNLTQKQKIQAAIKAGTLQVGDVNEMTEYDIEQLLKAKGKRFGGKVKKMKLGGEAKPLVGNQFKLDKNKDGKISGEDFAKMKMGGKVKEYGGGGKVKGGKMTCRDMGAAIKGGGFSIS